MDIVDWALRKAQGEIVDPSLWFSTWAPKLTDPDDFRLAALFSNAASNIVGPYTPARKVLLNMTGFNKNKLYKIRESLEAIGCMRYTERGTKLATVYEFVMPEKQGKALI